MGDRIAFLGMGNMGQAMTKNLVMKGNLQSPVILYNRTYATALSHSEAIGNSKAEPEIEAIVPQADIIWTCLSNQDAVSQVFDKLLVSDNVAGKLFVDSSTIAVDVTNSIHKRVLEAGADFVAMPVFGEPTLAGKGQLICVPAGRADAIERIKPYIVGVVARGMIELREQEPGQASLLKLLGNTFILNTMEMVAEGHVFAEKTGLGTENLHQLVESLFPIGPAKIYSNRMRSGEYRDGKPMVEVGDARKLADTVMSTARSAGVQLPAYRVATDHLEKLEKIAGAKADITGIYGVNRQENGLGFDSGA